MSKSDENAASYVLLLDRPDDIMRKFRRAVTDSETQVAYREGKDGINNLMSIYATITGRSFEAIEAEFEGKGYGDFKSAVGEAVVETLRPVQERYGELMKNRDYLESVYTEGAKKALSYSLRTFDRVCRKVGLVKRGF
jgi:tryptophanyl-tRNA synthetase